MVTVRSFLVLLLLGVAEIAGGVTAPIDITPAERKAIDRFVKSQEIVAPNEYASDDLVEVDPNSRQYAEGTLLDGEVVLVVLYTMEIATSHTQFLAVFDRTKLQPLAHARIGGKGYRQVQLDGIEHGLIRISATYYSTYDGYCCPTVSATSVISLESGSLEEGDLRIDCESWTRPEREETRGN